MEVQLKQCYNCKEVYPKEQFHHEQLCPICVKKGVAITRKTRNRICEECGVEFTHSAASRPAKFCSRKCFTNSRRTFSVASLKLANRKCEVCGKPIGENRGHNALTCSPECSKIRRNTPKAVRPEDQSVKLKREQAEKTARSWKEIIKLCSKLHISYGQYQTLETFGQLDNYIKEHSDLLA